jgi:signal transduction histidine kinase
MLYAALSNLLQNAFMSTPPHQDIALRAYGEGDRVLFEVEDPDGALSAKVVQALSQPPGDGSADGEGPARGVSIARRAVEAMGGSLRARATPGAGCVFTIDLPRHIQQAAPPA